MGNMNVKVGTNNSGYEVIMGKQGIGSMNENCERFADVCADYNLVVGGTVFPHKQIVQLNRSTADKEKVELDWSHPEKNPQQ